MKHLYLFIFLFSISIFASSQSFKGEIASSFVEGAEFVNYQPNYPNPTYLKLQEGYEVIFEDLPIWFAETFKTDDDLDIIEISRQLDEMGHTHVRFHQTKDGNPVLHAMFIAHMTDENKVYAVNGRIYSSITLHSDNISLSEENALSSALNHVNAEVYKWELKIEEKHIKQFTNDRDATHYPKGEKFVLKTDNDFALTYRFNIYAHKPMSRQYVYVDASTGVIVEDIDLIHHTNVQGTAVTKYSGTRPITTDSTATTYRLRETTRGNGVETYNMLTGTSYGAAVDFTDTDNYWDNANAQQDEIATDAHWGAEMTYDYYYNIHGRNSIDDQGFKLVSYVHYDQSYANAFWNGQYMTYGDGNASWSPLTALDICGHEVSHGLTSFTAGLIYQNESGAMNEAFSDIFGTAIEFYAKPFSANWLMGENIGSALRSMSNPNLYGDPDTYLGNNYYLGTNDNGGVHTNSGVLNYWFYLLSDGGSGTNDIGNAFNVTGIGVVPAAKIAYRMLTVYLVNSSEYADARFYAIMAAADLYGPCSQQMISATNAMYAVGIGPAYAPGVLSDFTLNIDSFCAPPAPVQFTNASVNAFNYYWDFGDGTTGSALHPSHTYNNYGTYDVKLVSDGGLCGIDSVLKVAVVSVDTANPCFTTFPQSGLLLFTACSGKLFDSGGTGDYQNNISSVVTIEPPGAAYITLDFQNFDFESGFDYLYIYDGPSILSPLIGIYDGNNLPNGGLITSTNGAITLHQVTDGGVVAAGFELNWQCYLPVAPAVADFYTTDTLSCDGIIEFKNTSTNGAFDFEWEFGDGSTSIVKDPTHQYVSDGFYTITLKATNIIGSDTLTRSTYVNVQRPVKPKSKDGMVCQSGTANLSATVVNGIIEWYDNVPGLGGIRLDTGNTFTTPSISQTTDYYVQNIVPGPIQTTGKPNNSGNGGYFTSAPVHYLVFDVYQDLTLESVVVYAQDAGTRTIRLQDSGGNNLQSKSVVMVQGQQTVNLNFDISPGVDYRLAGPSSPGLYRSNGSINYPYEIPGLVSIHRSSANSNPTGYYYFFYDWKVRGQGCISNLDTVTAFVHNEIPEAKFNHIVSANNVAFTNTSLNGVEYEWDFNDGITSLLENPSHTYTFDGTYDVTLTAVNGCGDDSIHKNINIATSINELDQLVQIKLYPNPTKEDIELIIHAKSSMDVQVNIQDALGRILDSKSFDLLQGSNQFSFETTSFSAGIYYLSIISDKGNMVKKFITINIS